MDILPQTTTSRHPSNNQHTTPDEHHDATMTIRTPTSTSTLASVSILIINPNTSTNMTVALEPVISGLGYQSANIKFSYFTCPTPGIPSINSPADAAESAKACLPALKHLIPSHDAFLVACYSHHPLVHQLQTEFEALEQLERSAGTPARRRYVTGIFEGSVTASLSLVGPTGSTGGFGIVSTGKVWEEALAEAVGGFLGGDVSRFLGCETTGLNASELHELPAEQVRKKMMEATKRVVAKGRARGVEVRAVCLGCAGMVGLEEAVRTALVEELGEIHGRRVGIVDGVKAGVGELVMLARGGFYA